LVFAAEGNHCQKKKKAGGFGNSVELAKQTNSGEDGKGEPV
jgi:hypothetical protein